MNDSTGVVDDSGVVDLCTSAQPRDAEGDSLDPGEGSRNFWILCVDKNFKIYRIYP